MKKMFLSDVISDEEIASWKAGDRILITTPTGSGKSYFVLKKLLTYAIKQGKHILYLCNRKILDEQLTVSAVEQLREFFGDDEDIPEEQLEAIHIVTYQYCEAKNEFRFFTVSEELKLNPENTLFYVMDEAHYFLSDALFNSGTHFWYEQLKPSIKREIYKIKEICIFITATPEPLEFFFAGTAMTLIETQKEILKRYVEKAELKDNLKRPEPHVNLRTHTSSLVYKTQRKINEACREIQPYEDCLRELRRFRGDAFYQEYPKKSLGNSYGQIDTFYFSEYDGLLEKIFSTPENEKWLILLDKKDDGEKLEAKLNFNKRETVFLHSKNRKKGDAKRAYEDIVKTGSFSCSVLIATKVLDCGVSITDPKVKHIVVSHSEKTTFLQMLGRRRMAPNEQISLYIRCFEASRLNGIILGLDSKMRFLVGFGLRNEYDFLKRYQATSLKDGMIETPTFLYAKKNRVVQDSKTYMNLLYTLPIDRRQKSTNAVKAYAKGEGKVLEEFEYNESAFLELLYELDSYASAMKTYRSTKDPCFYLKWQLGWLGKSYDERNWINYEERMNALFKFLEEHSDWMNKDEQTVFSGQCSELLGRFPVPPKGWKSSKSAAPPGLNKLNKYLKDKGIPYKIVSKQRRNPQRTFERASYWRVIRIGSK